MIAGVARLLEDEKDFDVVGVATTLAEAKAALLAQRPDVVLLDLQLGKKESGFSFVSQAMSVRPEIRIIVFSTFDDAAYRRQAETLGACGYVVKGEDIAVLKATIRRVAAGEVCACGGGSAARGLLKTLSHSEEQVVQCLFRGLSEKEAANELGITASTVATYVHRAKEKLGVKSVFQLIAGVGWPQVKEETGASWR